MWLWPTLAGVVASGVARKRRKAALRAAAVDQGDVGDVFEEAFKEAFTDRVDQRPRSGCGGRCGKEKKR